MEERIFSERVFLNTDEYHSSAYLVCYLEDYTKEKDWQSSFYGFYKIANCDRGIELSIDLSSEKDLDNTLHKLQNIIDITSNFKDAAERLRPRIKEHEEKKKIKDKEEE